jgi:hypothetical protein
MTRRSDLIAIYLVTLLARIAVAAFQEQPGYMDAYYTTVGAQRLAEGYGFTEPYVWNYLDDPSSLPHPSYLYWMPLPSIAGALSMTVFGPTFRAAQVPFVMLSATLPPIAYTIAWRATAQRRAAWIAALLMLFSGYYLPFWGVPESFTTYAVAGSLALLLAGVGRSRAAALAAGVCAGLAHLSRADGLLLLIPVMLNAEVRMLNGELRMLNEGKSFLHSSFRILHSSIIVLLGYLIVMLPWFLRNMAVVGMPLSTAGAQSLWLCDYDELFSFGVTLDVNHWLGCGIERIFAAKARGLGMGLVHLAAENGLIFVAPLMAVGLWRRRRDRLFRPAILYLALLFLTMTLAFTFVGDRGGMFHSSGALMPFLCAAAPIGLDEAVGFVARRRRTWHQATASRVFGIGIVALAALLSLVVVWNRVVRQDWNGADITYRQAGAWLAGQGDLDSVVMVGNPPGFTFHTGRPSIVTPNGDVDTLLAAARRFGAKWLILDANRPVLLAALYDDPNLDARLKLTQTFGKASLFEIVGP